MTRPEVLILRQRSAQRIGEQVAVVRRSKGLTQTAVARGLDRPQSWMAKVEAGVRTLTFVEAVQLAQVLGVSVVELIPSD